MLNRLLRSRRLYFVVGGLMIVAAIYLQFDIRIDPRPLGEPADIEKLSERDDLNILFVLIDTLRADRLSAYGYERETSPTIDAGHPPARLRTPDRRQRPGDHQR